MFQVDCLHVLFPQFLLDQIPSLPVTLNATFHFAKLDLHCLHLSPEAFQALPKAVQLGAPIWSVVFRWLCTELAPPSEAVFVLASKLVDHSELQSLHLVSKLSIIETVHGCAVDGRLAGSWSCKFLLLVDVSSCGIVDWDFLLLLLLLMMIVLLIVLTLLLLLLLLLLLSPFLSCRIDAVVAAETAQ